MAYVRFTKSRKSYKRKTANTYRRSRYVNKPVAKAKTVYQKKSTGIVPANRRAINVISRQVQQLRLDKFGQRQWFQRTCNLQNNVAEDVPTSEHPIFFEFNNFYDACPVYRASVVGGTPVFSQVKSLRKKIYLPIASLQDEYQWQARSNTVPEGQLPR